MLIKTLPPTLHQIFCTIMPNYQVIIISNIVWKICEREMFIATLQSNFLQIFCIVIPNYQTIIISIIVWKIFEREMFIKTLQSTFLQIFCIAMPNYQVISISIIDADDNFTRLRSSWYLNGHRNFFSFFLFYS